MNIVVIEDEMPAYRRIVKLLEEIVPEAQIGAHHDSVVSARQYFEGDNEPDVVLLDIHLADGSAFDLLKMVKVDCPIIFTTAYDQYAIDAFKAASIDYLLKPVKKEELKSAFEKLDSFKKMFNESKDVLLHNAGTGDYKKRFLIRYGEHIKTLNVEEIAYCYSENKVTFARTFEGRTYPMDYNLDGLEQVLDPLNFFRINRQYIINLKAIDEMRTYSKARVIISLKPAVKENPVVSSERSASFKQWLAGEFG